MRPPSKFPARAAIPVGIPRPATSTPFAFSARRNGSAVTEIMRPASPILIRHNPGDCLVMPRVPLVLTGPAGPSVPQGPGTGKVSGAGWNDPGQDRSGLWLRNAAAGLCVLAAAAAAVSFTAQYRMAETRPPPPRRRRPRGRHPGRRRPGLRLPRHRPGPARPPGTARPGAEPGLGRRQRVHERDRGGSRLAEPGHLGHAPGRLRPGQRHPDRRRPRPGPRPPPPARRRAGRRRGHPAGRPRRPGPVAAAPGPGPRLHPGRVPRLGAGRVPGRPRPPRPGTGPAPAPAPRKATKTARFLALATERHGSLASIPLDAVAAISADLAPRVGLHPGTARAALRKAVLAAKNGAPR